ncbi:hypothetical protein FEI15_03335 [Lacticaseibacillus zeae]|uniref:Uncharacterized protein n=1 Tax=Lacticaseibacillus zeae TaxID=57037 RepID=A0A5R8LZ99_LACZE|nr:hypothetical protein FEI15_03335 [Lacticaseibacillus zeae]TLF42732.1 hypothetical protein FEI14_03675 [Lacticaseibacillus zeae]
MNAMAKDRPSRPRPLTLRLLTAPAHAQRILTRSSAQKLDWLTLRRGIAWPKKLNLPNRMS